MAVVLGGQQLLVPQNSVMQGAVVSDVVGGVVPVLGAQPVQASLGARSLPVAGGKSIRLIMSDEKRRLCMSGWRKIVTVNLGRRHASAAAQTHPAPYISYVRAPAASGENPPLQ